MLVDAGISVSENILNLCGPMRRGLGKDYVSKSCPESRARIREGKLELRKGDEDYVGKM